MATIWSRINTLLLLLVLLALAAIIGMLATRAEGGPLDPGGAPGSTDGVRLPGTPITSLPLTISQPGNYYLTRNLTISSADVGITVFADGVTIDLAGFTLDGANQGTFGIQAPGGARGLELRNGLVNRWTMAGVDLSGVRNAYVHGIHAHQNGGDGIRISGGTLADCSAWDNGGNGIVASLSTISNCMAVQNDTGFLLRGSTLRDCVTQSNSVAGVNLLEWSSAEGCLVQYGQVGIIAQDGSTVRGNTIKYTNTDAIQLIGIAGGNTISENNISNVATFATFGAGIAVITNDNRINRNNVSRSEGPGIYVQGDFNTIDENSSFENTGTGIVVVAGGEKNTVVGNSSLGNGNPVLNYSIAAGNNAGPVVAAASATNPLSNTQ